MSGNYGRKIVTSGIVGYWDFANRRSYSGEPTINKATVDLTNWSAARGIVIEIFNETPPVKGGRVFRLERTNTVGQTFIRDGGTVSGPLSPDSTLDHTFSVYVKFLPESPSTFHVDIGDGARNQMNKVVDGEWHRLSCTGTGNNTDGTRDFLDISLSGNLGPVLISSPQVELKPYPTPFIPTERLAVDGLRDLSGNNRHIDIENASYDEGGLYFDGVTDSINRGIGSGTLGNKWTIGCWVKLLDIYKPDNFGLFLSLNLPYLMVHNITGAARLSWRDGGGTQRTINGNVLEENKWYYIVGTHDGNNTATLYIDGEIAAQNNQFSGSAMAGSAIYLGSHSNGSLNSKCRIDSVVLHNRDLKPDEVKSNFDNFKGRYL